MIEKKKMIAGEELIIIITFMYIQCTMIITHTLYK